MALLGLAKARQTDGLANNRHRLDQSAAEIVAAVQGPMCEADLADFAGRFLASSYPRQTALRSTSEFRRIRMLGAIGAALSEASAWWERPTWPDKPSRRAITMGVTFLGAVRRA
jgi:hypothetical protein